MSHVSMKTVPRAAVSCRFRAAKPLLSLVSRLPKFAVFLFVAAVPTPSYSAPITPRGIPDGAVLLAHLDLEAARNSAAATAAFALCETSVPEIATFKKLTGVSLFTDASSITIGLLRAAPEAPAKPAENQQAPAATPPAKPQSKPATPPLGEGLALPPPAPISSVAILRGQFKPAEIFDAASAANCPSRLILGYTFLELSDKGHPNWKLYVTPLGPRALALLTDIAQAPALIAAWRDASYSRLLPAGFANFVATAAPDVTPLFSAVIESKETSPEERISKALGGNFQIPEDLFLLLADDGKKLRLRAKCTYPTEAGANQARIAILGAAALLKMVRTTPADAASDEKNPASLKPQNSIDFSLFLEALEVEAIGKIVRLKLDRPAKELAEALQKAVEQKRAKLAAPVAPAPSPVP